MIPIFVGSDIISEVNSEDGVTQVIERRCKLNVEAPYLLKKVLYYILLNLVLIPNFPDVWC